LKFSFTSSYDNHLEKEGDGESRKTYVPYGRPKGIKEGKLTDIYFVRTMQVLKAKRLING